LQCPAAEAPNRLRGGEVEEDDPVRRHGGRPLELREASSVPRRQGASLIGEGRVERAVLEDHVVPEKVAL
jgi:hypothetical protein